MPNKFKYQNYFDFEKKVKSGKVEPVYFVLSEDNYFLSRAGDILKEKFTGSTVNNENYFVKYGDDSTVEEIINLSSNFSSLFSSKKIIIVRKCEKLGRKLDSLLDYVNKPSPDTTIILSFSKEYVEEKKLNSAIDFYDFTSLDDKEYYEWLKAEFENQGCRIDDDTLIMFSEYVPRIFGLVVNEIKKVSDFLSDSGEKVVNREVILKLSGYESEFTPMELVSGMVTGKNDEALKILDYLLNKESVNEVYLVSLITSFYMDMMATKNENIQMMQNRAFYMNYKIWGDRINFVKNHQKYAKKLNFEKIFTKLIETDSKLKSSMIDPKVLLISMVQEISSN